MSRQRDIMGFRLYKQPMQEHAPFVPFIPEYWVLILYWRNTILLRWHHVTLRGKEIRRSKVYALNPHVRTFDSSNWRGF